MISRSLAAMFACTAVLTLGGCFTVQENTFGESLDETSAGTEISTKLLTAGGNSKFGSVDVQVSDRFVLLSGRVPSEADKAEAERIAWTVKSVDEIANELEVRGFDFGGAVSDTWINTQVRAGVVADKDIKGVNYNIRVYDGVVYLLGFARSEDELRRAADHASRVKGVKKVVSYVKMRERGQPAPIETAHGTTQTAAAAPAPAPAPVDAQQGAISITPASEQPAAPIVPPSKPPTTRAQYGDPYAPGAAPPPGANNSLGLQSAPLPPARPQ